jgi:hypothetical protein
LPAASHTPSALQRGPLVTTGSVDPRQPRSPHPTDDTTRVSSNASPHAWAVCVPPRAKASRSASVGKSIPRSAQYARAASTFTHVAG